MLFRSPTSLAVSGGGFTFAENANVTDSYYTQPLDTAEMTVSVKNEPTDEALALLHQEVKELY